MLNYLRSIQTRRREDGASAVEYGLLVAAIAALIVIIVFALGGVVKGTFTDTCSKMVNGNATDSVTGDCSGDAPAADVEDEEPPA